MLEQLHAAELEWLPAEGETPRAVARLSLARGGSARYVEYTSGAGRPCGAVLEDGAPARAFAETGGYPCADDFDPTCREACLFTAGDSDSGRTILAGTVAAAAASIRLLYDDGSSVRYALTGPLSRLDASRRIFMVEQQYGFVPAHELLEGDTVVARLDPDAPDDGMVEPGPMGSDGVEVALDGTTLRVEIAEDASAETEALLVDNEVVFVCSGTGDSGDSDDFPASHVYGRFPPGERTVTVELGAPVSGKPIVCFVAGGTQGDEPGAYRMLVSPEELEELEEDG